MLAECHAYLFLEMAASIVLSSWKKETEASYTSTCHQWNCWCNQMNHDLISAPVNAVLEFLTEEFHKSNKDYDAHGI